MSLGTLLEMLTYARPMGSDTEAVFCARFIQPLPGTTQDGFGNWHVIVGDRPSILWSCHTDTVHRESGRHTLHVTADGVVGLSRKARRRGVSCLGADDTAGVWLCRELILAGVPGHYIFHYGEERGGVGSGKLKDIRETFDGIACAIALDRRGTADVITHQWDRCCSDAFARSLAEQLNIGGLLTYQPDDTGIFTDTANYTDVVGECTNLSVGYRDAHSPRETLDTRFLLNLVPVLANVDPSRLVIARQPGEVDADASWRDLPYVSSGYVRAWDRADSGVYAPSLQAMAEDVCQWCGDDYWMEYSDARDPLHYCDRTCEQCAFAESRQGAAPVYLTAEYADVQTALRQDATRRLAVATGQVSTVVRPIAVPGVTLDRSTWPRLVKRGKAVH